MKGFFKVRDESRLFTLEDLTKPDFFKDLVYLDYWHSTGLGGPGVVYMIMENSALYQIGLGAGFPYAEESKLGEYIPLLDRKKELPRDWRRWKSKETFIREDYFEAFERLYKDLNLDDEDEDEDISSIRCAEKFFKCDKENDYLFRDSYEEQLRIDRVRRKCEEDLERVRLTNGDVNWIEVPLNIYKNRKIIAAHYVLLFRKTDTQNVYSGVKWTIVERKKEVDGQPMSVSVSGESAQSYALYYKSYSNMAGILKYRDKASWYSDNGCYSEEYSTLQDGIMEKGEYVDSYLTLEAAKEGALYRSSQVIGWAGDINKETLVHFDWSDIDMEKMREETREIRLWNAREKLFIAEHYREICEVAKDYPRNDDAINSLRDEAFKTGIPMKEVRGCIYDVCQRLFGGYTMDELVTSVMSLENKKLRDKVKTTRTKSGYVIVDTVYISGRYYYETMVFEAMSDGSVTRWDDLDYARAETFDRSVEAHLKMIEKWKR